MTEENALSKVIINGQEYDPADAQELIELGSKTREFQGKWNTSLDKVYPDYTRATQEAAEARQKLAEYEGKLKQYEETKAQTEVPQNNREAIEAARKIGLADREWMKEQGYVTKADVDNYFAEKQRQAQATQEVLDKASQLEKEIDGSDGRIPFDKRAVLAYANAYGFGDLQAAYDEMNGRLNAGWKAKQLAEVQKPGLKTIKSTGNKTPEEVKVTDDNKRELLRQALWGSEE